MDFSLLENLSLSRSRISNAVLTRLGAQPWFSAVRRLDLSYTPLSSRGARWSHRPNALTHIDLSGTRTTERMLDGITNGCQLRVARIANSQCTADGVQRLLTGNAQTLQVVDISGTPAPAGLFSREEAFPALHTLSARGTALCARDFHGLLNGQHFPVLHSVDLGACSLISECEVRASSPSLTNLWLSGAAIGTSATRLLGSASLPSLRLLDLSLATFEESPARQLVSPVQRAIHVLSLTVDHQWSSDDIESVLDSVAPSVLTLTVESTGAMASREVYRWLAGAELPRLQELDLSRLDTSQLPSWPEVTLMHLSSLWVSMSSLEQLARFSEGPLSRLLGQLAVFGSPPFSIEDAESLFENHPTHVTIL